MSKTIKKTFKNKKFRIASACAAVLLVVVSVAVFVITTWAADPMDAYYGELDPDTGVGEFEEEYVFGTKVYTKDNKFTVLEISTYDGYAELGYMVDNNSCAVSLADIQKLPNWENSDVLSAWKQAVYSFIDVGNGWKNVDNNGYIKGNDITQYTVDGKAYYDRNFFARGLTGTSYLSNKFQVIAKSAKDVTADDIRNADLVFVSNGSHANSKSVYSAMANAAASSGNAELMAKYPVIYSNPVYDTTNDISKEAAVALIEHNIVNDKAVIFDKAAGNNNNTNLYMTKVYYMLLGIDSDDLRDEFMSEKVTNETIVGDRVTGYKGSIGYFDTEDFEVHFIGPDGWYAAGFVLNEDGDWVFASDVDNVWIDNKQVSPRKGELITKYGFDDNKNKTLTWNGGMFLYQIGQDVMKKSDGVESRPYYYNSTAGEEGYMNGSIYVFNGDCSLTQDLYGKANTGGGEHRDNDYDAAKEIYGDDITNNEVIKYLLGIYPHENQPAVRILEIQPAGFFEYSKRGTSSVDRKVKDFQTAIDLMYMLGGDTSVLTSKNYERKVLVTSIAVNGYNGLTADLTTDYDLVIVGSKTGDDGTDSNSIPALEGIAGINMNLDRRDNLLDGLIYTPIGDMFALNVAGKKPSISATGNYYAGWSVTGPGYTRMSGYDFTQKGYEKILEFVKTKKMPIILADEIYDGDTKKIGSTTYVYKLHELAELDHVEMMKNASMQHDFGIKTAYWNVASKRVSIIVRKPGELQYEWGVVDVESSNAAFFVKPVNSSSMVINFEGDLRGAPNMTYHYELYIDRNGDGIYRTDRVVDDNNEIFASGNILTGNDGAPTEMDGASLEGQTFSLQVSLTDSMLGYFKWKLVVTEVVEGEDIYGDNSGVVSSTSGAFIVRENEEIENKSVKVLQIVPDLSDERDASSSIKDYDNVGISGGFTTYTKYGKHRRSNQVTLLLQPQYASLYCVENRTALKNDSYYKNRQKDLEKLLAQIDELEKNAKNFQELFAAASNVTGIELDMTTLTTSDYEKLFYIDENGNYDGNKAYRGEADYEDFERNPLLEYDMVVMGFGDKYALDTIGNKQGAVDLLKEFASRGNAILFSHDTMMYSNYSDGYLTAKFSEITYGTDINYNSMVNILRAVSGQDRYGVSTSIAGHDKTSADNNSEYWKNDKLPTIEDKNGKIYSFKELGQLQGFASNVLFRYAGPDGSGKNTTVKYNAFFSGITNGDKSYALNETTQATKLNDGQVTQYPYLIDTVLDISTTHGQWFQLDLEGKEDKSQEVVVWYALTSDKDNNVGQYYRANGIDAANDYYIYSKGNITYSGAGHSAMGGEAEQKLFINTIVRAITSANSAPEATIESAVLADEKRHLYTQYFRKPIEDGAEESLVVTFKGEDADLRKPENATDTERAGQFKEAFAYWDVNDNKVYNEGVDVVLSSYKINVNPLYNMIPMSLDLKDFYNTKATYTNVSGNKVTMTLKEALNANEARVGVVIQDSNGGRGTASVKFVLRELFELN